MEPISSSFGERFLEQLVGTSLIGKPKVALIELIANSWDAEATRVDISWPLDADNGSFFIRDNGHGMTHVQFIQRFMEITYDRSKDQGTTIEFNIGQRKIKRRTYGKNGIGRLGGFCFADKYYVTTSSDGKEISSFEVCRINNLSAPIQAISSNNDFTFNQPGTVLYTKSFDKHLPIDVQNLKMEIGMRFLSDPDFEIFVNGEKVDLLDIPNKNVHYLVAPVPNLDDIQIIAIDTQKPDGHTYQHGVAWHVIGRLVGECRWKGPNNEKFLDGRKSIAKRFTFIVKADCLENIVAPDWSGFNFKDPLYNKVFEAVSSTIHKFIADLSKEEYAAQLTEIKESNRKVLKKLSPLERESWEDFIIRTQEQNFLNDEQLGQIATILANLQLSKSRYALLHKLSAYNSDQLENLNTILGEWTADMAKVVLDELKIRMRLVHEIQVKVKDKKTNEVQELQPLFEKGLWIFGPEFEAIDYTSNRGMTTVLQELFGLKITGSLNRPDFVVIPDGSIGVYSLPAYDKDDGAECGVSKVIIVELKKPGIPIGSEQKEQCWKYVKELYAKGAITDLTEVRCFALGTILDPMEANERTEKSGRVIIRPMNYDTVMTRANSRLFNLKKKIETAPFLEDPSMKEFIEKIDEYEIQQEFVGI